jgi:tetratricopeptide (TPR) repeat protein
VLARLGSAHAKQADDQKALQYYNEAYDVNPVDVGVLTWLGTFHARCERFEKACAYFDQAGDADYDVKNKSKWQLAAASCLRKAGDSEAALRRYLDIHSAKPADVECLRHLAHVCGDLGREDDAKSYAGKLRAAERERDERGDDGTSDTFDHGSLNAQEQPTAPSSPSPLDRSRSGMSEDEWGGADLDLPGM